MKIGKARTIKVTVNTMRVVRGRRIYRHRVDHIKLREGSFGSVNQGVFGKVFKRTFPQLFKYLKNNLDESFISIYWKELDSSIKLLEHYARDRTTAGQLKFKQIKANLKRLVIRLRAGQRHDNLVQPIDERLESMRRNPAMERAMEAVLEAYRKHNPELHRRMTDLLDKIRFNILRVPSDLSKLVAYTKAFRREYSALMRGFMRDLSIAHQNNGRYSADQVGIRQRLVTCFGNDHAQLIDNVVGMWNTSLFKRHRTAIYLLLRGAELNGAHYRLKTLSYLTDLVNFQRHMRGLGEIAKRFLKGTPAIKRTLKRTIQRLLKSNKASERALGKRAQAAMELLRTYRHRINQPRPAGCEDLIHGFPIDDVQGRILRDMTTVSVLFDKAFSRAVDKEYKNTGEYRTKLYERKIFNKALTTGLILEGLKSTDPAKRMAALKKLKKFVKGLIVLDKAMSERIQRAMVLGPIPKSIWSVMLPPRLIRIVTDATTVTKKVLAVATLIRQSARHGLLHHFEWSVRTMKPHNPQDAKRVEAYIALMRKETDPKKLKRLYNDAKFVAQTGLMLASIRLLRGDESKAAKQYNKDQSTAYYAGRVVTVFAFLVNPFLGAWVGSKIWKNRVKLPRVTRDALNNAEKAILRARYLFDQGITKANAREFGMRIRRAQLELKSAEYSLTSLKKFLNDWDSKFLRGSVAIGVLATAVVATALTAGYAAAAFPEIGAGGLMVLEGATFTTVNAAGNYAMFGHKPTVLGFLFDLGTNIAMFGVFGRLAKGLRSTRVFGVKTFSEPLKTSGELWGRILTRYGMEGAKVTVGNLGRLVGRIAVKEVLPLAIETAAFQGWHAGTMTVGHVTGIRPVQNYWQELRQTLFGGMSYAEGFANLLAIKAIGYGSGRVTQVLMSTKFMLNVRLKALKRQIDCDARVWNAHETTGGTLLSPEARRQLAAKMYENVMMMHAMTGKPPGDLATVLYLFLHQTSGTAKEYTPEHAAEQLGLTGEGRTVFISAAKKKGMSSAELHILVHEVASAEVACRTKGKVLSPTLELALYRLNRRLKELGFKIVNGRLTLIVASTRSIPKLTPRMAEGLTIAGVAIGFIGILVVNPLLLLKPFFSIFLGTGVAMAIQRGRGQGSNDEPTQPHRPQSLRQARAAQGGGRAAAEPAPAGEPAVRRGRAPARPDQRPPQATPATRTNPQVGRRQIARTVAEYETLAHAYIRNGCRGERPGIIPGLEADATFRQLEARIDTILVERYGNQMKHHLLGDRAMEPVSHPSVQADPRIKAWTENKEALVTYFKAARKYLSGKRGRIPTAPDAITNIPEVRQLQLVLAYARALDAYCQNHLDIIPAPPPLGGIKSKRIDLLLRAIGEIKRLSRFVDKVNNGERVGKLPELSPFTRRQHRTENLLRIARGVMVGRYVEHAQRFVNGETDMPPPEPHAMVRRHLKVMEWRPRIWAVLNRRIQAYIAAARQYLRTGTPILIEPHPSIATMRVVRNWYYRVRAQQYVDVAKRFLRTGQNPPGEPIPPIAQRAKVKEYHRKVMAKQYVDAAKIFVMTGTNPPADPPPPIAGHTAVKAWHRKVQIKQYEIASNHYLATGKNPPAAPPAPIRSDSTVRRLRAAVNNKMLTDISPEALARHDQKARASGDYNLYYYKLYKAQVALHLQGKWPHKDQPWLHQNIHTDSRWKGGWRTKVERLQQQMRDYTLRAFLDAGASYVNSPDLTARAPDIPYINDPAVFEMALKVFTRQVFVYGQMRMAGLPAKRPKAPPILTDHSAAKAYRPRVKRLKERLKQIDGIWTPSSPPPLPARGSPSPYSHPLPASRGVHARSTAKRVAAAAAGLAATGALMYTGWRLFGANVLHILSLPFFVVIGGIFERGKGLPEPSSRTGHAPSGNTARAKRPWSFLPGIPSDQPLTPEEITQKIATLEGDLSSSVPSWTRLTALKKLRDLYTQLSNDHPQYEIDAKIKQLEADFLEQTGNKTSIVNELIRLYAQKWHMKSSTRDMSVAELDAHIKAVEQRYESGTPEEQAVISAWLKILYFRKLGLNRASKPIENMTLDEVKADIERLEQFLMLNWEFKGYDYIETVVDGEIVCIRIAEFSTETGNHIAYKVLIDLLNSYYPRLAESYIADPVRGDVNGAPVDGIPGMNYTASGSIGDATNRIEVIEAQIRQIEASMSSYGPDIRRTLEVQILELKMEREQLLASQQSQPTRTEGFADDGSRTFLEDGKIEVYWTDEDGGGWAVINHHDSKTIHVGNEPLSPGDCIVVQNLTVSDIHVGRTTRPTLQGMGPPEVTLSWDSGYRNAHTGTIIHEGKNLSYRIRIRSNGNAIVKIDDRFVDESVVRQTIEGAIREQGFTRDISFDFGSTEPGDHAPPQALIKGASAETDIGGNVLVRWSLNDKGTRSGWLVTNSSGKDIYCKHLDGETVIIKPGYQILLEDYAFVRNSDGEWIRLSDVDTPLITPDRPTTASGLIDTD